MSIGIIDYQSIDCSLDDVDASWSTFSDDDGEHPSASICAGRGHAPHSAAILTHSPSPSPNEPISLYLLKAKGQKRSRGPQRCYPSLWIYKHRHRRAAVELGLTLDCGGVATTQSLH